MKQIDKQNQCKLEKTRPKDEGNANQRNASEDEYASGAMTSDWRH